MARDFRSRNNRSRQVQHTTRTVKQPYQEWGVTGRHDYEPGGSRINTRTTPRDNLAITGNENGYMEGPAGRMTLEERIGDNRYIASGYNFGRSDWWEVGLVDKVKTTTHNQTSTSYNPDDTRDTDEEDDKSKNARLKKQGRSGLRIKLQADPSAGRLKGQDSRVKKKSGAQGGGPTGLNIPR